MDSSFWNNSKFTNEYLKEQHYIACKCIQELQKETSKLYLKQIKQQYIKSVSNKELFNKLLQKYDYTAEQLPKLEYKKIANFFCDFLDTINFKKGYRNGKDTTN